MFVKIVSRRAYDITKLSRTNFLPVKKINSISVDNVPEVSHTEIKKLIKLNATTFEDGYTNFIIPCPLCKKTTKKSSANIYINKMTGMYTCVYCKSLGSWSEVLPLITKKGKKIRTFENDCKENLNKLNIRLKEILDTTEDIGTFEEDVILDIFSKFALPEVTKSSISHLNIRIDKERETLYLPLESASSDVVGYRSLNCRTQKETQHPSTDCLGILTGKPSKTKDVAVVVPNIFDFFYLLNSNITTNVVCLPNGLSQLPQQVLPSLERFHKLILWFGDSIASWDSARTFARKLGEKRCMFVRPTDNQVLPHLVDKKDLKAVIAAAQPVWHKSITTFASLRQDVLSELQNIDKVQGVKWKRYPSLNKILKGHRRGELTIITGPTGSGKTTFISEYSLDLALQGVNTLWGSFEIRNARLARTMLQQMVLQPLDENLNKFEEWADQFEDLPIYFMTFHGEQTIKVVMEAVEHATYVHDIAHVIIDNLQFMMGMTEEAKHMDRFWKQDLIIAAFRQFATRKNCHVTLVIHPRKERDEENLTTSSIFGGAKASQEADNVFIIQDKRLTSIKGKKYLQIAKNRYSGDLGIIPLEFDKAGLSHMQKKRNVCTDKLEDVKLAE